MSDYLARAARCATVNQFNHLHIQLETVLTPIELAEIGRLSSEPGFPERGRDWLAAPKRRSRDLFERPQPFVRREVTDRLIVYEGPMETGRGKRLLIAFTGAKRRMMIPTPEFLQAIDARAWDVVYLKHSNSFLDGLEGVADGLDGLLDSVMAAVAGRPYASVSTLGVSAGGPAAAVAALRLKARSGVSICGAPGARYLDAAPARSAVARLFGRPRLAFLYGADFAPDREGSEAMARRWRGRLVGVRRVATHNVMGRLLVTGKLAATLGRHL